MSESVISLLGERRAVGIFGSSEPGPDEPAYQDARRAAARLAGAGLVIVSGGYGGVMAGASQGATEAGGTAIGVTVDVFDRPGGGNRWLTHEIREPDLYLRTRSLVEPCSGFLILPGRAGTLAEVSFLWALRRAQLLGRRPVVLAGPRWQDTVAALQEGDILDPATLEETWIVSDVDEAVTMLMERLS